ncbi:MAG: hypothetical protein IJ563_11805 [Selenomonadaceae bacterium]|nr:hypothetical protein [Selenomonadaceae bacterium]
MKRKIKFRGKCAAVWRKGDHLTYANGEVIKQWSGSLSPEYTVEPETVGQFTGAYDVDGKEIYEADVVQYTREDKYRYIVVWNDELMCYEGKCIDNGCNVQFLKSFLEKCRIVGNIFDNPELNKERVWL